MPARNSFDYAVIRIVPHVEREEFVNAGVIIFCRTLDYLDVKIDFELKRLKAITSDSDFNLITSYLSMIKTVCKGGPDAGYFGALSKSERFHWLVSPSSTIIQTSPVHCGLCENPREALEELYQMLVA